jgi:hypothetical protein
LKKKRNLGDEEKMIIGMISIYRRRMKKSKTTAKMLYCRDQMDLKKAELGILRMRIRAAESEDENRKRNRNYPPMTDTLDHCSTCDQKLNDTWNCLGCPSA